jgi:hypothetical protein
MARLVKKFPVFHGIRIFVTVFTAARYCALSRVLVLHLDAAPSSQLPEIRGAGLVGYNVV